MKRYWQRKTAKGGAVLTALALLSGCALPSIETLSVPADVADYIPADIDMSEVNRDTHGCYFYTYGASLFTVEDDNGDPICHSDVAVSRAPSWDWQLSAPYDLARDVSVIDLDADNHSAAEIAALNARGITTICYVSVGTLEDWRDDIHTFPASVIGRTYGDWPDEKFLDIRQRDVLLPLMRARFQTCKDMGFAAIEPDNQDVYANNSGFEISATETLSYLTALADLAHDMGLRIAQKNVPELTPQLVGTMDFVITEGCFDDGWCGDVQTYAHAGKPIYAAEYTDTTVDFAQACAYGDANDILFILKDRDLTAARQTCP
jgi:endo-alpha-1,4-polygalactosaminidase (GH114 family)